MSMCGNGSRKKSRERSDDVVPNVMCVLFVDLTLLLDASFLFEYEGRSAHTGHAELGS